MAASSWGRAELALFALIALLARSSPADAAPPPLTVHRDASGQDTAPPAPAPSPEKKPAPYWERDKTIIPIGFQVGAAYTIISDPVFRSEKYFVPQVNTSGGAPSFYAGVLGMGAFRESGPSAGAGVALGFVYVHPTSLDPHHAVAPVAGEENLPGQVTTRSVATLTSLEQGLFCFDAQVHFMPSSQFPASLYLAGHVGAINWSAELDDGSRRAGRAFSPGYAAGLRFFPFWPLSVFAEFRRSFLASEGDRDLHPGSVCVGDGCGPSSEAYDSEAAGFASFGVIGSFPRIEE